MSNQKKIGRKNCIFVIFGVILIIKGDYNERNQRK